MNAEELQERYQAGQREFRDLEIDRYANLSNSHLKHTRFINVNFHQADFNESNLGNAIFSSCKLNGSSFKNANLSDAQFEGCNLHSCKFTNANLNNTNFRESSFSSYPGDAEYIDFTNTNFNNTNLIKCKLAGVNFIGIELNNTDFADSDLSQANFMGLELSKANLKGTKLDKAVYNSKTIFPQKVDLTKAYRIDPNSTIYYDLANTNFRNSNLSRIKFVNANLDGTRVLEWIIQTVKIQILLNLILNM